MDKINEEIEKIKNKIFFSIILYSLFLLVTLTNTLVNVTLKIIIILIVTIFYIATTIYRLKKIKEKEKNIK